MSKRSEIIILSVWGFCSRKLVSAPLLFNARTDLIAVRCLKCTFMEKRRRERGETVLLLALRAGGSAARRDRMHLLFKKQSPTTVFVDTFPKAEPMAMETGADSQDTLSDTVTARSQTLRFRRKRPGLGPLCAAAARSGGAASIDTHNTGTRTHINHQTAHPQDHFNLPKNEIVPGKTYTLLISSKVF